MKDKELLLKIDSIIDIKKSNIDDLNLKITELQFKIDSLEKSLLKLEIGQNYFSDIINLQLVTYVLIVSAIGLISWGGIVLYLKRRIRKQSITFKKLITKHNEDFETSRKKLFVDINKVKNQATSAELQVLKAMYFSCWDSQSYLGALLWSVRLIKYFIDNPDLEKEKENENENENENEKNKNKIVWLDFGIHCIKLGVTKEQLDKTHIEELENVIAKCGLIKNEEFISKLTEFKHTLYKVIYS